MNPKDLLKMASSISVAAAALLLAGTGQAPARQAELFQSATSTATWQGDKSKPAAKLLLAPASRSTVRTVGHTSHSSHSSHSSHVSGSYEPGYDSGPSLDPSPGHSSHSSHSSHYSHQSGANEIPETYSPVYVPPSTPAPRPYVPPVRRIAPSLPTAPTTHSSSTDTALMAADLAGKSDEQLALLRNSYYAHHGYSFIGNGPTATRIRHYFAAQPWYRADTDSASVAYSRMSAVEIANITLIRKIETQRKSPTR